jgi:uncharacterized protein (UPF0218 family)
MIWSESCRVWDPDGEVCKDCKEAIGERAAEGEVVGDFVDGEEEVLVCGCTDYVGC